MKRMATALALFATLSFAGSAFADDSGAAQGFAQQEHAKLITLLKQPASSGRDAQINQALDRLVDYDELGRRSMGQPCPVAEPSCQNHWNELSDAQKSEVTSLLKQLVQKNYRKNLIKTLDFDIIYKDPREQGGDVRIRTEAKSKVSPRDPSVQVDIVLHGSGGSFHVVDVVTEGSSLTKNYYDQFHKMLTDPSKGYPHLASKLREKIGK